MLLHTHSTCTAVITLAHEYFSELIVSSSDDLINYKNSTVLSSRVIESCYRVATGLITI